jgi:hypothetical protein
MKTIYNLAAAILFAGLASTASAYYYNQDFDSMGTTGSVLPTGWSVWYIAGGGSSAVIPSSADMATANNGVPSLNVWNQTDTPDAWSQQAANMGATASDPNRLLGTSATATRGTILQLSLNNYTASAITTARVTYDMKNMTAATADELPGYSFYYLDGSTWTHLGSLDLASDGTASALFNYTTPVAVGGNMEFRWFDDNAASFSPDTMIAIDNVTVVPEPTVLSLLAVGALALIARRRKV